VVRDNDRAYGQVRVRAMGNSRPSNLNAVALGRTSIGQNPLSAALSPTDRDLFNDTPLLFRAKLSVFGQPLIIACDAKHRAVRFGVRKLFRNSARFFSAAAPMLGIVKYG
jgi:hypothetical protein